MPVKYDVVTIRTDEKTDKKYYTNIGRVLETEKGLFIKLDVIPVGWNGFASFYTPKPKDKPPAEKQTQSSSFADLSDDIPF
jgi:hypothetical protein